jgi:FkbM family methyltransferase
MNDRKSSGEKRTTAPRRGWVRAIVPAVLRRRIRSVREAVHTRRDRLSLRRLEHRLHSIEPGATPRIRVDGIQITVNDGPVCFHLYKDLFVHRIYHFDSSRPDPLILDCGSNVGMSILYFKKIYPRARIIGFEPDPVLLPFLEENVSQNGLRDVTIVKAAVADRAGTLDFFADGLVGSSLAEPAPGATELPLTRVQVPAVRLRDYLNERVDFLKLNIEGAEWSVLADCADRLRQVERMVVEYHHLPGLPRTLHKILTLLDETGFEYIVSDFGIKSYNLSLPPISLGNGTRYFRHIYAQQRSE